MTYASRRSLGYVVYYSLLSFIPVSLIVLLSNEWYYLLMKTLSGIFIIGFFIRLLRPQASNLIGPAGPGFIINTFLFGLWLATPWFWLKLISNILIASILIANYKMIKNES